MLPVKARCDFEGHPEMVNGFPLLPLGSIYLAEDTVGYTEKRYVAFRDEIDRAECGFLCGVELAAIQKRVS